MSNKFYLKCYKSIAGGFVAWGEIKDEKISTLTGLPVWFACQAEEWPDLQVEVRKLVTVLQREFSWNPRTMPIEMRLTSWAADEAMIMAPGSKTDQLLRGLSTVEENNSQYSHLSKGITTIKLMKLCWLTVILPEDHWKPEMESCMLSFILNAIKNHPGSIDKIDETKEDLINTLLSNAM